MKKRTRTFDNLLTLLATGAALLLLTFVGACTRSSKPDELVSDRGYKISFDESYYVDVQVPFDEAWAAVLQALEDLGWTVETQTETSGMIATIETEVGTDRDRYACRQWPGSRTRVDLLRCKLAVHVGSETGVVTRIRAAADVEGRYVYVTSQGDEKVGGWWQCSSTGEIESQLFDALLLRLEPLKYDPPVYRRSTAG